MTESRDPSNDQPLCSAENFEASPCRNRTIISTSDGRLSLPELWVAYNAVQNIALVREY